MKRIISLIAALLACISFGVADELYCVPFVIGAVSTAAAGSSVTCPTPLSGEVQAFSLDWSGYANPTGDVTLATASTGAVKVARTLFHRDEITADAVYYPERLQQNEGGTNATTYGPFVLFRDFVTLSVDLTETNHTDIAVTGYLLLLDRR